MRRARRITRNIAIGSMALIVAALIAGLAVIRTAWFRNYVRQEIVSTTQESTGGRVEVGSFDFDASHLRATIGNFVIHGNEPDGMQPFLRIGRVVADIRLFTAGKLFDIAYLGVDRPAANILILPDGRTNIPSPKNPSPSKQSPLRTVVNLAVGHFELNDGLLTLESRKQAVNIRGNNLRVQLSYSLLSRSYSGDISLEPLYVVAGRNEPVTIKVAIPLTIGGDRVDIHRASISTASSTLSIDGSFENMKAPRITARINGTLATIDLKNAGNLPVAVNGRGVPSRIDFAANFMASGDSIRVTRLQTTLGHSIIEASGDLKDSRNDGSLTFRSTFDLGELGRLFMVSSLPQGVIQASGNAKLGIGPNDLSIISLNMTGFGGRFLGSVSLQNFRSYRVNGEIQGFDLKNASDTAGLKLPYDGIVSGPIEARGDTKVKNSLTAQARLSIVPGKHGIPASGRINADFSTAGDNLTLANSYVLLPHTRLDLSGTLDKALNISLKTTDLNDLLAAVPAGSRPPVALNHGEATLTASVTGNLKAPRITGHIAANRFVVEGRQFDSLATNIAASDAGAVIRNGVLTRATMQAGFSGSVGLRNWKALPREPVSADVSVSGGDLADVVALAGRSSTDYSGALSATAHIAGTVGNPLGTASIEADRGTIDGQPFDQARVQANLTDRLIAIPVAYIREGAARIDLSGEFRHPKDSLSSGQLQVRLASTPVDLSAIAAGRGRNTGRVQVNADVAGTLNKSEFLLTHLNADISAKALRIDEENYGDLQANARTNGQAVNYNLTSDFAGSSVHLTGNTQLISNYPTTADASITNLPIDKALAAVKRTGIPARGNLSGTIHLTGTTADPHGSAEIDLTRAVLYDEPIDRLQLRAAYLARSIDISQLRIVAGPSRLELSAHYDHPAGNLSTGVAAVNVESSSIDLARIRNIQTRRPGLGGVLRISGHGEGTLGEGEPRVTLRDLNLSVAATGISAEGRNFGDLKLAANKAAGNTIAFTLDSNLADASIRGSGTAGLQTGYPVDAKVSFNNVLYTHFANLLGMTGLGQPSAEAAVDGKLSVNGPVLNPNQLRANLLLTRLNITANPTPGQGKPIVIANQGPLSAMLDHGALQIQNAHLSGGKVDIQAGGGGSISGGTLALTVTASAGLDVLPAFNSDIYSSGSISLAASMRGTISHPLVNGQITLHDATFNYAGLPNGISRANGVVNFSGNTATIQNLTADSGGGKITLTGFASYAEVARFGLRLKASGVRSLLQQGVSVVVGADVQLTGTSRNSLISGSAVIDQVTYNPRTDIASLLSRATPSVQSVSAPSPLLDNMRLDIRVRTSSGLAVQAQVAQSLSASADLRVQGTAAQPGILGRITINEGQLVFFGSTYTVDTGTIAFYNPLQIDPILDISLETETQGVSVTVRVTGPFDNMKLSYTSNPPLQFQEIVALLAAGRTPTSDPTLLANQPQIPQSSLEQMGESAALGEAVANPVAGRLQRVFGLTQLKVDPMFQTGSETPTARLSLEQRITNNLTFTYTSALDDPNGEIIEIEWAFDPKWSAVATRDQNGIFSINFLYKRQFR